MRSAFVLLIGLTASTHALAAPSQGPCELHVWINKTFVARGHFGRLALGTPGAIELYLKPYENVEGLLREYLDPAIQAELIAATNVPQILGLRGYEVVLEPPIDPTPRNSGSDFQSLPRLSSSQAPCYAELRVISTMYEKTALSRMFYSWFVFRQFNGPRMVFAYNAARATQVGPFPPKGLEEATAARADVRRAFVANLRRFLASGKFKKLSR